MKFAAIDIGSNAVRFQISRPLSENNENPAFKKVEYTRLPLRLGEDVFTLGKLSDKKVDLLIKSMQAFVYLMEIFNVDGYLACATSAMRDAENSKEVLKRIKKETGIQINIISGMEESEMIRNAVLDNLPTKQGYIHVDVGGGSTEISFIKNGKLINSESFNVGTVRMFQGANISKENTQMKKWVKENAAPKTEWKALGSGGNINKLFRLINEEKAGWISLSQMKYKLKVVGKMSKNERIYQLGLNPDRAEVINHAGIIYTNVMRWAKSEKMYVSGKGLKEGIIKELWKKHLKK
jgi:exopolyphosphatase/guanosine-5'-triphosphate,3'-diphosphate pyrophosphatase